MLPPALNVLRCLAEALAEGNQNGPLRVAADTSLDFIDTAKIMNQNKKELGDLCGHICQILSIIIQHTKPEPELEGESRPDGFKTLVEEFIRSLRMISGGLLAIHNYHWTKKCFQATKISHRIRHYAQSLAYKSQHFTTKQLFLIREETKQIKSSAVQSVRIREDGLLILHRHDIEIVEFISQMRPEGRLFQAIIRGGDGAERKRLVREYASDEVFKQDVEAFKHMGFHEHLPQLYGISGPGFANPLVVYHSGVQLRLSDMVADLLVRDHWRYLAIIARVCVDIGSAMLQLLDKGQIREHSTLIRLLQPENILLGESGNTVISVVMLDGSSENRRLSGKISDHDATELLYTSRGRLAIALGIGARAGAFVQAMCGQVTHCELRIAKGHRLKKKARSFTEFGTQLSTLRDHSRCNLLPKQIDNLLKLSPDSYKDQMRRLSDGFRAFIAMDVVWTLGDVLVPARLVDTSLPPDDKGYARLENLARDTDQIVHTKLDAVISGEFQEPHDVLVLENRHGKFTRHTFRNAMYVRYYHIRNGVKTLQDSSGVPMWEHFFSKIAALACKYGVPAHKLMIVRSIEEHCTDCRYQSPHESPEAEVYLFIPDQDPYQPFWSLGPTPATFQAPTDSSFSVAGAHAQIEHMTMVSRFDNEDLAASPAERI